MNPWQRLGTFLARVFGMLMVGYGLMGFAYLSLLRARRLVDDDAPHFTGMVNLVVFGFFVQFASPLIGRSLGKGLGQSPGKPQPPGEGKGVE